MLVKIELACVPTAKSPSLVIYKAGSRRVCVNVFACEMCSQPQAGFCKLTRRERGREKRGGESEGSKGGKHMGHFYVTLL